MADFEHGVRDAVGGSHGGGSVGPPAVRASDAERERTVERLRDAAAEGRLTFEELSDRVGIATEATTRDQLESVVADLPTLPNEPSGKEIAVPTRESTVFGDIRRSGVWKVPAESRWKSLFGDVTLDLRAAQVTAAEVTIEVVTVFGDIELLVPEGVTVEIRSGVLVGDVRQDAGEVALAGSNRVILTGRTIVGDVRVRSRRLSERLAEQLPGVGGRAVRGLSGPA